MLSSNTNKIVWMSVIIALFMGFSAVLHTMFPLALDEGKNNMTKTIGNFLSLDDSALDLKVNIPNQKVEMDDYLQYHVEFGSGEVVNKQQPYFEPNTFNFDTYKDTWGFIEPNAYFNYTSSAKDWENTVTKWQRDNNFYEGPVIKSPFEAMTSKKEDVTKSVRFVNIEMTQIDTWDNKTITSDTEGLKFNHKYTNYGDLLTSIYDWEDTDARWDVVKDVHFTATYSAKDSAGHTVQKSDSFVVSDDGYPSAS